VFCGGPHVGSFDHGLRVGLHRVESGSSAVLQLTNESTNGGTAVVTVTHASLCRSHAAYACLLVDAEPATSRIDLNDSRMRLVADVRPGDDAVLVVALVDVHNGTMCIALGDARFTLEIVPND